MKVFTSVKELRAELDRTEQSGIGFVPTMGALHAGHRSLVERARRENATVVVRHLGGALARMPADSTSFSQRNAPYIMQTLDVLTTPQAAERAKRHTQAIFEAMQPHSTGGVLPSWLGDGDYGVERMRAGFAPEHYQRLVALKDRYDPTNMFRMNHNIPPSGFEQ